MSAALDPSLAADAAPAPFAEAMARAEHDKGRTVLTRAGRPVAVLVPIEDMAALDAWEDARDAETVREGLTEYARDGMGWPSYSAAELAALWGIDLCDEAEPTAR